ncbi:MalY/PatB family protein [Orbus sturtevantii]|uniref:MalY/PatB family protein n=1 Tax=Orbus sturtevantii TaxID=3074109 RepID=UPI00370DB415
MFDFDTPVNRKGTWCTQWDYVQDRFGIADLIPFTISDMDFKIAPCIEQALNQRISHGVLGYSRWNNQEYFEALSHWYLSQFSIPIDTNMTVYGPSVIYMVAKLINLWSHENESIVVHTPAYDAFYKAIIGNNRKVEACPLIKKDTNWLCDMDYLETLLGKEEVKILLLCSPHNPTGKVWSEQELKHMAQLCEKYHVKVISDEIHMDMIWQEKHLPWSQFGLNEWALLSSASKSFNIPALTGAYGFINCQETKEQYSQQLKAKDGLSSPAVLSLVATIAAYQQGSPWLKALKGYLRSNLDYVAEKLNTAFPQLKYTVPQSTYLAWIDLRALNLDEQKLQHQLIHHEKVAIMPGSTYGLEGKGFLRLNVGCSRSKVEVGVNAIINAINSIK